METAIFANGCFWCTEAIFQQVKGVLNVKPGYIGGDKKNPTYKEVCTGETNHAEALKIEFDPAIISYTDLLEIFFATHDPTTPNRQGNDIGTQYRSEIFYTNELQKKKAEDFVHFLIEKNIFSERIVTQISPASTFWEAEVEHHNYFLQNMEKNYCAFVIYPKLENFKNNYSHLLRK